MNEIALLESVELRIASAESEEAFAGVIQQYLCPILRKLASSEAAVREKVVSICQHINARVRENETIGLPVRDLVGLFCSASSVAVQNFSLIYVSEKS